MTTFGFIGTGHLGSMLVKQFVETGAIKAEQILATKADYCITPCHNCHAQVHDLSDVHGHKWQTVHLWTLICLSLGVLGPKERAYLGDDLKDVLMFHPEQEE